MKLLHTADWQIGRRFNFSPGTDEHDPNPDLWLARFDAVASIATLAASEHVDAILVAGDVFDLPGLSDTTLRRAIHAMAGFSGRWVLLPGNHDAAIAQSIWSRLDRLQIAPENVTCALEVRPYVFSDLHLSVLAAPLTQRQTHTDVTDAFDGMESPAGYYRVGLAHGSVSGVLPDEADAHNQIAQDRAQRAKLDYLALGDWHGYFSVNERTAYSGTPEPDRFKANDSGNVLVVEINAPGAVPRITPRRIAKYRWEERAVDLLVNADVDQLRDSLANMSGTDVLRLHLHGTVDASSRTSLQSVLDDTRARVQVLDADMTQITLEPSAADLSSLKVDGTLIALVDEVKGMQSSTNGNTAALGHEAMKLLFDALTAHAGERAA